MTQVSTANVFLRNDTIFGTCQVIGDEFGITPNWLRVPLAASVLISPTGAFALYLGLSLVVLAARTLLQSKPMAEPAVSEIAEKRTFEANDDQRDRIAA
jgi:phage shock protein PspC (stress-responsive transcriptional regulator)